MTTLKDIAERVGVSPTAVSHVLNGRLGRVGVSAAKQKRIFEVTKELGYVPNQSARSLVTRKSFTLGVITSDHLFDQSANASGVDPGPYVFGVLKGVEEIAKAHGYHSLFATYEVDSLEQLTFPKAMRSGSVDGVVLVGHSSPESLAKLAALGLPTVQIGQNIYPDSDVPCVYHDLEGAIEQASHHLYGLGHRRIQLLFPAGPGPEKIAARFRALESALPGLTAEVNLAAEMAVRHDDTRRCAETLARRPDRPTAFICPITAAAGLVGGLGAHGMRVPEDYSLIVCAPAGQISRNPIDFGQPRLSCITLSMRELGRRAAWNLLHRLGAIRKIPRDEAQPRMACDIEYHTSVGPAPALSPASPALATGPILAAATTGRQPT